MSWLSDLRARYRPLMHDRKADHQIRLTYVNAAHAIAVSCQCRKIPGRQAFEPLAVQMRWEADEILAVYDIHLYGTGA
jgi:hypothetical protein